VTGGIGGGIDFVTRIMAQGMTAVSGQQMIVDNRPSGTVPREIVNRAPADGYTLLVAGATLWIGVLIQKSRFDPLTDLTPVSLAVSQPSILVVNPSVPAKSVKELIALAKAKPAQLNYASASTGAASHLAAELFKSMAGVDIVRITYKSGSQRQADLLGGQVQVGFATGSSVEGYIKTGKLRALGVTSKKASQLFPDLPPIAASLPGYEAVTLNGVFGPPRMPAGALAQANRLVVRAVTRPEIREKFLAAGLETVASTPAELAVAVKEEMKTLGKLIKDLGLTEIE
jgi:tripartite-type tricarboxylate transporter receptor subunit TctC